MQFLVCIAVLVAATHAIPGDSIIDTIFPRYGSLAGGTELTILGANFQRENISGV
jgi:hypothetical protein